VERSSPPLPSPSGRAARPRPNRVFDPPPRASWMFSVGPRRRTKLLSDNVELERGTKLSATEPPPRLRPAPAAPTRRWPTTRPSASSLVPVRRAPGAKRRSSTTNGGVGTARRGPVKVASRIAAPACFVCVMHASRRSLGRGIVLFVGAAKTGTLVRQSLALEWHDVGTPPSPAALRRSARFGRPAARGTIVAPHTGTPFVFSVGSTRRGTAPSCRSWYMGGGELVVLTNDQVAEARPLLGCGRGCSMRAPGRRCSFVFGGRGKRTRLAPTRGWAPSNRAARPYPASNRPRRLPPPWTGPRSNASPRTAPCTRSTRTDSGWLEVGPSPTPGTVTCARRLR